MIACKTIRGKQAVNIGQSLIKFVSAWGLYLALEDIMPVKVRQGEGWIELYHHLQICKLMICQTMGNARIPLDVSVCIRM